MYKYDLRSLFVRQRLWSQYHTTFGIKVNERIKTTEQLATVLKSNQFELYLGE